MKKTVPLGYKLVNGELVIDEEEAKIVKHIFAKLIEYTENPPQELVDAVIESAQENGENLTYEEAKERVSYDAILWYLQKELNTNAEFIETINKNKTYPFIQTNTMEANSHPIISREDWEKAQKILKK